MSNARDGTNQDTRVSRVAAAAVLFGFLIALSAMVADRHGNTLAAGVLGGLSLIMVVVGVALGWVSLGRKYVALVRASLGRLRRR